MELREFQMNDYPQVVELWRTAGLNPSRSDTRERILEKLKRDADLFLVAHHEGMIVGVIMGCFDGRRGWIHRLAVSPGHQKTGLGSLLVRRVEERLRAKGCEKANLLIEPSNSRVQGFYERLGYERDELIFMGKWLD